MNNLFHGRKREYLLVFFGFLVFGILLAVRFDYYYDLNDDMLIKDIVSGSYTGTPNGHNIQMLYPISWLLSLPYYVIRQTSWYGLFFVSCHFLCFGFLTVRSMQMVQKGYQKLLLLVTFLGLMAGFLLYEFVFIQYTVTTGILGATAAFLLYTTRKELSNRDFFIKNIGSVLCIIVAYQIRSEMLLLIFPMIGVVGLWKWSEEEEVFAKKTWIRYGGLFCAIIIGLFFSQLLHSFAYGSKDWKTFQHLFDSRTELYDFQTIPDYAENEDFYESLGLKESEQKLFENYNYGIDTRIDAQVMDEVAKYASEKKGSERDFFSQFKSSLSKYITLLFREKSEIPWNQLLILCYLLLCILSIYEGKRKKSCLRVLFFKLPLLFFVRSGLWLFIIYRGRIPNRISHTLYVVEILLLAGLLLSMYQSHEEEKTPGNSLYLFALILIAFYTIQAIPATYRYVAAEYNRREEVNQEYLALRQYCAENQNQIYFLDVYSTVAYSEKVFRDCDNTFRNYEYLGGWACNSPCNKEKLAAFHMNSMEEGICNQENVYVMIHQKRDAAWLSAYLLDKGYHKKVQKVDEIVVKEQPAFEIYQLQ